MISHLFQDSKKETYITEYNATIVTTNIKAQVLIYSHMTSLLLTTPVGRSGLWVSEILLVVGVVLGVFISTGVAVVLTDTLGFLNTLVNVLLNGSKSEGRAQSAGLVGGTGIGVDGSKNGEHSPASELLRVPHLVDLRLGHRVVVLVQVAEGPSPLVDDHEDGPVRVDGVHGAMRFLTAGSR